MGTLPDPQEGATAVLMDKLGERLAFERSGTRLYDALLVKCETLGGGDPTQQTPCADVAGVEGMGLMQVLTDPKTTLGQALHAIPVAEMTDNAGWEELITLTEQTGNDDLVKRFAKARDEEREHLEKVRRWYRQATMASMNE